MEREFQENLGIMSRERCPYESSSMFYKIAIAFRILLVCFYTPEQIDSKIVLERTFNYISDRPLLFGCLIKLGITKR